MCFYSSIWDNDNYGLQVLYWLIRIMIWYRTLCFAFPLVVIYFLSSFCRPLAASSSTKKFGKAYYCSTDGGKKLVSNTCNSKLSFVLSREIINTMRKIIYLVAWRWCMKIWDNRNTFSLINKSGRFSTVTTFVSTLRLTDTLTSRVRMREREREKERSRKRASSVKSRRYIYSFSFPVQLSSLLAGIPRVHTLCGCARHLRFDENSEKKKTSSYIRQPMGGERETVEK